MSDTAVPDAKAPDAGGCCALFGSELFDRLIKKAMMKKDKRVRINKRMMAWSNGARTNVIPSVWREVDDYGRTLVNYHRDMREGDENLIGTCGVVRDECRCREYEADRYWERGMQVAALEQMMGTASRVLPDESVGFEFEDVQWLNPKEMVYWHPNVLEFLRLMRRCEGYCKQNPRLWPLLESSRIHRAYRRYLSDLGRWARE